MPKQMGLRTFHHVKLLSVSLVLTGVLVCLPVAYGNTAGIFPKSILSTSLFSNFDAKDVLTTITNWLPFGNDKSVKNTDNNKPKTTLKNPSNATSPATSPTNLVGHQTSPSLYRIMQAEFAADRGDMATALAIYKRQAFYDNATAVFERGLGLSIAHEPVSLSLAFAQSWQQQHPEHVPALFYVAHLALKTHDYQTAGAKLDQILAYDPDADLSQILIGIYPTQPQDQADQIGRVHV